MGRSERCEEHSEMSAPCCAHTLAGTSMHSAHKRSNTTQNTTRSHSCRLHQNAECTCTHNNTTYPHPQEHNFALSTNTQQSYKDASSNSDCYSYDSISSTNKQPTLKKKTSFVHNLFKCLSSLLVGASLCLHRVITPFKAIGVVLMCITYI